MSSCDPSTRRPRGEDGFTLVEVMVAFALLATVLVTTLPVLVNLLRSTAVTKSHTQAKNLSQERLDQLRSLRFHVDRQNGPFLDLLDIYYTNATSPATTTTVASGTGNLVGRYVATGGGTGGEPTAPYYRVTTGSIPGAERFSQVITSQFLAADGSPVPAARFQNIYDSQVVGRDQSPSLLLGVTVITTWTLGATTKSYRTYTRITDGRPQAPVIQSQSRAVAVDVTSNAADATTLELQAGVARLDGAQSSGSSVSGYVTGAVATRTGETTRTGLVTQFALPSRPVTTSGDGNDKRFGNGSNGCSWWAFGNNSTDNVTGDVSAGLPKAPANVGVTAPYNKASGYITNEDKGSCGQLSYDNLVGGGIARPFIDPVARHMGAAPYVRIPFVNGVDSSAASISGAGYVTSNPLPTSPQQTRAGASTSMLSGVVLFPNSPDPTADHTIVNTASQSITHRGLVAAILDTSGIDCVSGTTSTDGTVIGTYTFRLFWWGRGAVEAAPRWHSATWTYNSGTGTSPVLAPGSDVWAPTSTFLGDGTPLSALVQGSGLAPNVLSTGATNGLRGFPTGVFTLTTAPTLFNESNVGFSAINVQLGQLSCVADDQR